MRVFRFGIAAVVAGGLTLAACGGSDGTTTASGAGYGQPTPARTSDSSGAGIATGTTTLGSVLVDGAGRTLYGFTDDAHGTSTCDGACAVAWPPDLLPSAALPDWADPDVFSVITRSDGHFQLKAGRWPLYRFAGDSAPGDTNGQGSGGTWFAAAPDGSLIKG